MDTSDLNRSKPSYGDIITFEDIRQVLTESLQQEQCKVTTEQRQYLPKVEWNKFRHKLILSTGTRFRQEIYAPSQKKALLEKDCEALINTAANFNIIMLRISKPCFRPSSITNCGCYRRIKIKSFIKHGFYSQDYRPDLKRCPKI